MMNLLISGIVQENLSIVDNNIGTYGQCVLKLEKRDTVESFILRNNR